MPLLGRAGMVLRRPARLPDLSYFGPLRYSLTLCCFQRSSRFADAGVITRVRTVLVETAVAEPFDLIVYCFMPDHLHVLAAGSATDSNLPRFVKKFKQKAGFWYKRTHQGQLWQDGYYDHVLREDEVTLVVAKYILENPVRAGLVQRFNEYEYSGSTTYSLEELADGVVHTQA